MGRLSRRLREVWYKNLLLSLRREGLEWRARATTEDERVEWEFWRVRRERRWLICKLNSEHCLKHKATLQRTFSKHITYHTINDNSRTMHSMSFLHHIIRYFLQITVKFKSNVQNIFPPLCTFSMCKWSSLTLRDNVYEFEPNRYTNDERMLQATYGVVGLRENSSCCHLKDHPQIAIIA